MGSGQSRVNSNPIPLRRVTMIGVPMGYGQDWETGVEKAPGSLRDAGIARVIEDLGYEFVDAGDIPVQAIASRRPSEKALSPVTSMPELIESEVNQIGAAVVSVKSKSKESEYSEAEIKNSLAIGKALEHLFNRVSSFALNGSFVLNVGGDHSLGVASLLGMLRAYPSLCVVWVDAHGDCNTPESSLSKNYHGMPAAHALGWFSRKAPGFGWVDELTKLAENRLAYIGLRDLDPAEKRLLRQSKVAAYSMSDVDRLGIAGVMDRVLKGFVESHELVRQSIGCGTTAPHSTPPLHLTFDIDAIDPEVAPGTGTRARGGLTYRESHYICEALAATGRLVGMDIVEINPELDVNFDDDSPRGVSSSTAESKHNSLMHGDSSLINTNLPTVRLGIELVASALGKTIL